jgi:YbbR domain-containing protein
VRRAGRFLLRNWPLKLGAVLLATVLYSGLVLSENVRSWSGTVPVEVIRQPPGATLLTDLDPVTFIRYRAPLDVGVLSPDSFRATVDLSRVTAEPGGPPVPVPVRLDALDGRVDIVDFVPQELQVRLDPVDERQVAVEVSFPAAPEGIEVGVPQVVPSEVTVRGASSRVAAVRSVLARVSIDASALNVDRDVDLVAVDEQGNEVPNVVLEPERARVRITVARLLATRTLPVVPQVVGDPAEGYRIDSIDVEPVTVTVRGEEAVVMRMELVSTDAIDIGGRQNDLETTVELSLPAQVDASGVADVRVRVTIAPKTGSSTFSVAVVPIGARSDLAYTLATTQVNVTLAGPVGQLAAIDPTQLLATVPVADLGPGRHTVSINHSAPAGLERVSISPEEVMIVVEDLLSPASPSPTARGARLEAV